MKNKSILLLSAILGTALFLTGCTYNVSSTNDAQDEVIESKEETPEEPEESEVTDSEETGIQVESAPQENSITLIPEDTNYDEEESTDEITSEDLTEEEADELIVAATPLEEDSSEEESESDVEVDEITGREGNWATALCDVNVRAEPHNGEVIGAIEEGARVKILGTDGNWYIINFEGQNAYVYNEYFD